MFDYVYKHREESWNTMRSEVLLTNLEMFWYVVKQGFAWN